MVWQPGCPARTAKCVWAQSRSEDGLDNSSSVCTCQGITQLLGVAAAFRTPSQRKQPELTVLPAFSNIKKRKISKKPKLFGSKELGQNVWGNLILFVLDNGTPSFSLIFGGCEKRSCHSFPRSFRENEACQLPCFSLSHTEFPVRILIPGRDLIRKQTYLYNSRGNPHQLPKSSYLGHRCI